MNQTDTGTSALFRIAGVGASLAFGVMVATLFALQPGPAGLSFHLTAGSVIAFFVAAAVAWFYWRMVVRMATDPAPAAPRRKFIVFSVGLLLIGLLGFLYPLKFIPQEKRRDVFVGLALAFGCIGGVAFVMTKVRRFLDADQKRCENDKSTDQNL